VAAAFLAGRELWREPEPPPSPSPGVTIAVAHIPDNLVAVPSAPALYDESERRWEPLDPDEALGLVRSALAREAGGPLLQALVRKPEMLLSHERLLSRWMESVEEVLDETALPLPLPVKTRPFNLMRYEVTCGQYLEFLEDVTATPEKLLSQQELVALWSDTPPTDADADEWHWLAQTYLDIWWNAVAQHQRKRLQERMPPDAPAPEIARPSWARLPLAPEHGVWLLVPPSWVVEVTADERVLWAMPAEPNLPVTEVSWFDARAFARWASDRLAMRLVLPTELEWQRAFHRGHPYESDREPGWRYPWGYEPRDWACNNLNYWESYRADATPSLLSVNTHFPGDETMRRDEQIYSMAGNAAEWMANAQYRREGDGPFIAEESERGGDRPTKARLGGGSFRKGIADCSLDKLVTRSKTERPPDAGFRLLVRDLH